MTRSDRHRRPLRNRYQEGPGFLFLATSGGRPPGPPRREDLQGLRFRIRCVRTALTEGIAAALALGVSRTSLYRWRKRYAEGGIEALRHERRGPARERLPAWVERAVIVVRLLTYWNSERLAAEFSRRGIYPVRHHAVDALLWSSPRMWFNSASSGFDPLRARRSPGVKRLGLSVTIEPTCESASRSRCRRRHRSRFQECPCP